MNGLRKFSHSRNRLKTRILQSGLRIISAAMDFLISHEDRIMWEFLLRQWKAAFSCADLIKRRIEGKYRWE